MLPLLASGDFVLMLPLKARVGDVVCLTHPELGSVIKFLKSRDESGITLAGANPNSISSKDMGTVSTTSLLGRACFLVNPFGVRWLGNQRFIIHPNLD